MSLRFSSRRACLRLRGPACISTVMVSSSGDARSLEGGLLLLTPLYAADGQVYAAAQGPLVDGGYAAGAATNSKQVNHPTVGRVPGGGMVERDSSLDLARLEHLSLLLNDASFSTAEAVAASSTRNGPCRSRPSSTAAGWTSRLRLRHRRHSGAPGPHREPRGRSRRRAKVVVNERTGTVVLGKDVHLGAVSILHGNISIEVTTAYAVSQPNPLGTGQTEVVPQTTVKATEAPARNVELSEGASVEQLVTRLQAIGATARDVVSILQAIKAAGAFEAELEMI